MSEDKIAQLIRVAELRRQSAEVDYAAAVSAVQRVEEQMQTLQEQSVLDVEYSEWILTSLKHGRDEFRSQEFQRLSEKLHACEQARLTAREKLKAALVSEAQVKGGADY